MLAPEIILAHFFLVVFLGITSGVIRFMLFAPFNFVSCESRKIKGMWTLRFLLAWLSNYGTCYDNVAGWLAGCHMPVLYQNGSNFSTVWYPHHSSFLWHLRRYQIPRGIPSAVAINTRWVGKIGDFQWKSLFSSEMVQERLMVTMER